MNRRLLCIAGGGTGGHLMPALAIADAARRQWPGLDIEFIGAQNGLEARLLPQRNEQVLLLASQAVQGRSRLARWRALGWDLPRATLRILFHWRNRRPHLVLGVGGYASAPAVVAALLARIPVVLYEQNAMPGMVNRRLARWCDHLILGFEAALEHLPDGTPHTVTGNSVRQEIANLPRRPHIPPRLLVMGGSQGARFLNERAPAICGRMRRNRRVFSVHHLCGKACDVETLRARYADAEVDARVEAFCDDMASFYREGDVLLARAGAMTVSEVLACALPAAFVPLPTAADRHQHHNAWQLLEKEAALLLEQEHYDEARWCNQLESLLFDPMRLRCMRERLRSLAPRQAEDAQLRVLAHWLEEAP